MTIGDVERAADLVKKANAVVITAGAGMGVDSGLPDFRGPEGFWRAYPPYRSLGLAFEDLANPRWFTDDPALAWGFYGHRTNLYRKTRPHAGFAMLHRLAQRLPHFVFTSNVDGHFQTAGFSPDNVCEAHGSISFLQCNTHGIWQAPAKDIDVDETTFRAKEPFPTCPRCGALARPNILMFGDADWDTTRSDGQLERLRLFLADHKKPGLVVIECGAGTAIPTVRRFGEKLGVPLVRINVREPEDATVGLTMGAKEALIAIESHLNRT